MDNVPFHQDAICLQLSRFSRSGKKCTPAVFFMLCAMPSMVGVLKFNKFQRITVDDTCGNGVGDDQCGDNEERRRKGYVGRCSRIRLIKSYLM